jgi:hypothetical protein
MVRSLRVSRTLIAQSLETNRTIDKKLWLRPGSSHLFGRAKQPTLRHTDSYVLDAKSVSKKHLKISIAAVKAGTGSQLHTRTEVIVEDFSKLGTSIDSVKISQDTKILKSNEHVIRVAKYEHALRYTGSRMQSDQSLTCSC